MELLSVFHDSGSEKIDVSDSLYVAHPPARVLPALTGPTGFRSYGIIGSRFSHQHLLDQLKTAFGEGKGFFVKSLQKFDLVDWGNAEYAEIPKIRVGL